MTRLAIAILLALFAAHFTTTAITRAAYAAVNTQEL